MLPGLFALGASLVALLAPAGAATDRGADDPTRPASAAAGDSTGFTSGAAGGSAAAPAGGSGGSTGNALVTPLPSRDGTGVGEGATGDLTDSTTGDEDDAAVPDDIRDALAEMEKKHILVLPPLLEPPPHRARALVEIGLGLAGGVVWYWWDAPFNSPDWDLKFDRDSWRRKLITFDAVRFDTNQFGTNAVSHPRDYTGVYLLARGNHLSVVESFAWTALASTLWEFFVEFKEKPSINDLVMSPLSAIATGEPLIQLGAFFARARPTAAHRTFAAVLSPATAVHDAYDGVVTPTAPWLDAHGLPADVWHRFEFSLLGGGYLVGPPNGRPELEATLDLRMRTIAGYGRAGRFAAPAKPGSQVRLLGRLSANDLTVTAGTIWGEVSLLGRYWQDVARTPGRTWRGWRGYLGLATAFEYEVAERPGKPHERLGAADGLGLEAEFAIVRPHGWFEIENDLFAAFALVDAFALGDYQDAHGNLGLSTVLAEQRYYYALGGTQWTRVRGGSGPFELTLEGKFDVFSSLDSRDRWAETIGPVAHAVDRRALLRAGLGWMPRGPLWRIGVGLERRRRSGTLGESSDQTADTRLLAGVAFVL